MRGLGKQRKLAGTHSFSRWQTREILKKMPPDHGVCGAGFNFGRETVHCKASLSLQHGV